VASCASTPASLPGGIDFSSRAGLSRATASPPLRLLLPASRDPVTSFGRRIVARFSAPELGEERLEALEVAPADQFLPRGGVPPRRRQLAA
jgi:hypothetical protein